MTTIKSYTDIEQSRKLAEMLSLKSADGFWEYHDYWYSEGDEWEGYEDYPRAEPYLEYTRKENEWKEDKSDVPCWSLTALFNVLPDDCGIDKEDGKYVASYLISDECGAYVKTNPIDAVYEMIIHLHELNLL